MVAHSLDCDHLCVHTNILPLDHQAKLISSLFNEMTHQSKNITMVNYTHTIERNCYSTSPHIK